jgi:drug/metabolite transporter (DMT)-like permease
MTKASSVRQRWLIPVAFLCVYFFWGSTYVGIRYGVRFISPFFVSGLRTTAAALILLGILKVRGVSLRMTRGQLLQTVVMGWLLVTLNNSMLGFSERYLSAGFAALMTASIPILIAILEAVIPGGKPLSKMEWGGTMLGLGGLALLLWPALRSGVAEHEAGVTNPILKGTLILSVALAAWITGSMISSRKSLGIDPFVAAGVQMLFGGSTNVLIGTATGAWHTAHWNTGVFLALAWLSIGGSLIGFSAYTFLLHNVAIAKVTTNAYVNPMVAVLLSSVFLGESLHGSQWVAMAVILLAVAIVTASNTSVERERTLDGSAAVEEA